MPDLLRYAYISIVFFSKLCFIERCIWLVVMALKFSAADWQKRHELMRCVCWNMAGHVSFTDLQKWRPNPDQYWQYFLARHVVRSTETFNTICNMFINVSSIMCHLYSPTFLCPYNTLRRRGSRVTAMVGCGLEDRRIWVCSLKEGIHSV
jgi:hypothetical protein